MKSHDFCYTVIAWRLFKLFFLKCRKTKMTFLLPTDCLNEILENLEKDRITLHSCLLVNRLWCEISVRILWRDIWSFYSVFRRSQMTPLILSTLIACLPNESKENLHKNKI